MLLNPTLAEFLLKANVGELGVLLGGVVDVVSDAVSEGLRVGEAREKGSRGIGESFGQSPGALYQAVGNGLVDHLVDEVFHVPGIGRVGLDGGDAGFGEPASFADVLVLLPGLLRDVDALDERERLVLGVDGVVRLLSVSLYVSFRHDWQGKKRQNLSLSNSEQI